MTCAPSDRSAEATRDTAALTNESTDRSGEGRQRLDEVAPAIGSITTVANKVKTLVDVTGWRLDKVGNR